MALRTLPNLLNFFDFQSKISTSEEITRCRSCIAYKRVLLELLTIPSIEFADPKRQCLQPLTQKLIFNGSRTEPVPVVQFASHQHLSIDNIFLRRHKASSMKVRGLWRLSFNLFQLASDRKDPATRLSLHTNLDNTMKEVRFLLL